MNNSFQFIHLETYADKARKGFLRPTAEVVAKECQRSEHSYPQIENPLKPKLLCGIQPLNALKNIVIEGVENINGAPKGMYRDGGIIDYHFDLTFSPEKGLTLYPHFYPKPIPGWFDKSLKNRLPHKASYDNVLIVVPSEEFIASLPYGKIPDRKDFENMPTEQRIPYWQKVISESDRLGEAFMQMANDPDIANKVKPLNF